MGYYVQASGTHGKASEIANRLSGMLVTKQEAQVALNEGEGVSCVMDNGPFEAAAFCYDQSEFDVFADPHDPRPKTGIICDREDVAKETGFKG